MKKIPSITSSDILEFTKQADLLRRCRYWQSTSESKVNITYEKGEGVKFLANMPAREEIEVVLLRIRPFIEYEERLHVGRIITYLLKKYGESEFLRTYQSLFQPGSEAHYPAITINNKEYRMRDLLILYMYGKYLHLDPEKQAISALLEKSFGSLVEYFALSQIDKYIGIVLGVAGYIRKNSL